MILNFVWQKYHLGTSTTHNQLSSSVSQLGISIAVISKILQQDVSRVFAWKLGQIGLPMTVFDSSHQEDFQKPKNLKYLSQNIIKFGM